MSQPSCILQCMKKVLTVFTSLCSWQGCEHWVVYFVSSPQLFQVWSNLLITRRVMGWVAPSTNCLLYLVGYACHTQSKDKQLKLNVEQHTYVFFCIAPSTKYCQDQLQAQHQLGPEVVIFLVNPITLLPNHLDIYIQPLTRR